MTCLKLDFLTTNCPTQVQISYLIYWNMGVHTYVCMHIPIAYPYTTTLLYSKIL